MTVRLDGPMRKGKCKLLTMPETQSRGEETARIETGQVIKVFICLANSFGFLC